VPHPQLPDLELMHLIAGPRAVRSRRPGRPGLMTGSGLMPGSGLLAGTGLPAGTGSLPC
jgi:hypothetical protein